MAERRHEVPEAGHPEPARLRADGEARPAGGLRGPDAHLVRSREASGADPEIRRPRLRPDLPPQRRPQPGGGDRGFRPRRPAEADRMPVRIGALLWPQTDSWPTLRAAAERADRAG